MKADRLLSIISWADQIRGPCMGEKVDLHVGGYHLTEVIGTGGMGSVFKGGNKLRRTQW